MQLLSYQTVHCTFNSPYFYRIFEKAPKIEKLIIHILYVDTKLEAASDFNRFSVFKLENLKEICLSLKIDSDTRNSYLSKILRVFSTNQSIRSNLESFTFCEWIFRSNQNVYDILKAKSFGYAKCKVYENYTTGEYIELYQSKITFCD